MEPQGNCVLAFSLTPEKIAAALEHKAPNITQRINAMKQLQNAGWKVGLRFDPLIYDEDYRRHYRELFDQVFHALDVDGIHSVSLGGFRLPRDYFKTMVRLHPREKLFASPLEEKDGMIGYKTSISAEMLHFCREAVLSHVPASRFFPCEPIPSEPILETA